MTNKTKNEIDASESVAVRAPRQTKDELGFDLWLNRLLSRLDNESQRTSFDDSLGVTKNGYDQISFTTRNELACQSEYGMYNVDEAAKMGRALDGILAWHSQNPNAEPATWPVSDGCLDQLATANAWLIDKRPAGWGIALAATRPGFTDNWTALADAALRRAAAGTDIWPGLTTKALKVINDWLENDRSLPDERFDDAVSVLLWDLHLDPDPLAAERWFKNHAKNLNRTDSLASAVCQHNSNIFWMALLSNLSRAAAELGASVNMSAHSVVLSAAARDLHQNQMADLAESSVFFAGHDAFRACLERRTLERESSGGGTALKRKL